MSESDDVYGVIEFKAGPLTFSAWLQAINAEVERITELGYEDFPDWGYADAFGDGVEPVQAARDMLADTEVGRGFLSLAGVEGGW